MKRYSLTLTVFVFFCHFIAVGQVLNDSLKTIEPLLFKEDFIVFKNVLQQHHPSLYRYEDKKTIDKLFDSCYLTINQNTTTIQFFSTIRFLLSAIGDGHLYCGPSDDFRKYYDENVKYFPLQLKFINNNAYVFCNKQNSLPPETQILSINQVSINEIKNTLFKFIVSDGVIQSKKYWILSNTFWFYYFMVYGETPNFQIKYKTKDGKTDTITLNAALKTNIECDKKAEEQITNLKLDYLANNIALLTIKTFNYKTLSKNKEDFIAFMSSTFKELKDKKINKLIIDLRGNSGGKDIFGSLLYSYLTDKDFNYYQSLETVNRKLTIDDHPNLRIQKPSVNNFSGPVFFLINGLSFSATSEFCAIAKSKNRGVFIGEETGGGYDGNTSGNFIDSILPNTKIAIAIPTIKYTMEVPKSKYKGRGIIPDYIVTPNIQDIIQNKDIQMEFVIKLSGKK